MCGKWDADGERRLLLQIVALKNVKLTGRDWDSIAKIWNDGTKAHSFRMQYRRMRAEAEKCLGVARVMGQMKGAFPI